MPGKGECAGDCVGEAVVAGRGDFVGVAGSGAFAGVAIAGELGCSTA